MSRNLSRKDLVDYGTTDASSVAMLSMLCVDGVRSRQKQEGNFDCFGRASSGYCDQPGCSHYANCMQVSKALQILGSWRAS